MRVWVGDVVLNLAVFDRFGVVIARYAGAEPAPAVIPDRISHDIQIVERRNIAVQDAAALTLRCVTRNGCHSGHDGVGPQVSSQCRGDLHSSVVSVERSKIPDSGALRGGVVAD